MSKVKINPKYPNNPGLLEGKYFSFIDRNIDFMDDTNAFPTKAQLSFDPSTIGLLTYSSFHGKLRLARDQYWQDSVALFYVHLFNYRMTGDAYPKVFFNRSIDLKLPSNDNYWETPAEHEMTRFVFPSQVDGSNNWPAREIEGLEMFAMDNPTVPKYAVKLLSKVDNWSMESLINRVDYQSGGDMGSANINLPLSLGMSNPFLGATISWPETDWYFNGEQWAVRYVEYVWGANMMGNFSMVPDGSTDANGMHNGSVSSVEDGTGVILSYQDMHTFFRATRDDYFRLSNELAIARTGAQETHNIDGDDVNLNAQIAITQAKLDTKQAELNFIQEQIDSLNLEIAQLSNDGADQALIDAKQAEIDAKNVELNVVLEELNGPQGLPHKGLIDKTDRKIKLMMAHNGRIKACSLMKAWFLSDPMPKINMARCTINGVASPVLKNAFINGSPLYTLLNWQYITIEEYNGLQQNPVTPLEYFGEINLRYLPAVKYVAELKAIEGQMGDMIIVEELGTTMAFDGTNFTEKQYNIYDGLFLTSARATQDAKFKSYNEISLAMKPFTWAAHHIPAYMITENGEMRTVLDRTVFDFTSVNGTASTSGTTPQ